MTTKRHHRATLAEEMLRDLGGALLFGVPLVYTMEIWWLGETSATATLGWMTLAGALVAGAIRYSVIGALRPLGGLLTGLRCTAMSLLVAFGLAIVIGTLAWGDGAAKALGEAAAIGIPLAFGAALGAVLFTDDNARDVGGSSDRDSDDASTAPVGRDIAASALGALFIALPIAPTGEVPLIAAMTDTWRVVAAAPICLVLCYVILFASGFLKHRGRTHGPGFTAAASATLVATTVGLAVAAVLLVAFGVLDASSPPSQIVRHIAALSIPAVIGSAAGRIAAA